MISFRMAEEIMIKIPKGFIPNKKLKNKELREFESSRLKGLTSICEKLCFELGLTHFEDKKSDIDYFQRYFKIEQGIIIDAASSCYENIHGKIGIVALKFKDKGCLEESIPLIQEHYWNVCEYGLIYDYLIKDDIVLLLIGERMKMNVIQELGKFYKVNIGVYQIHHLKEGGKDVYKKIFK